MLEIRDNAIGISRTYIFKSLEDIQRKTLELEYDLRSNINLTDDIFITVFRGKGGFPMAGITLGPDGKMKLKLWHYPLYLSNRIKLRRGIFLKSSEDNHPSFNLPKILKSTHPNPKIVAETTSGITNISIKINNPHTLYADASVFIRKETGRGGSAFGGQLNWKLSNVLRVDLGCVYSNITPYDLNFDNISLNGDALDPDWFFIKDYQGFKDIDNLNWIGSSDPKDASTYSEPTKLANLARYDYAKVAPGNTITNIPQGIKWNI